MGLMSRFEQVPGMARDRHTRNGLIVLAVVFACMYYAYTSGTIPFLPKGGTVVTAEFATAANVTPGKTPVRVAGVNVGEVEKVERLPNGRGVKVKMRIEDGKGVNVRKDATAHIYWRTLLGFAFYIQLDEGSSPQKLGDQTIAMKDTTTQVELDQVLASLTPTSRKGMQTLFKEFDKGFGGGPSGRALDAAGPAMKQIAPGLDALRGTKPGDLTDTVRSASRLMGALARNEVQLGQVVSNADTTLGVTAARSADLDQILKQAPASLDQTKSAMVRLRTTLNTLDPVADALRPGVRELDNASLALRPALNQLRPTLDDARPLLSDLRPALVRLNAASKNGVPLLKGLEPTLVRLRDKILPALDAKGTSGLKLYEAIGPAIASVSSSASLWDAYGFTQRFQAANGGGASLEDIIPCRAKVVPVGLDCSAFQEAIGAFLGKLPGSPASSKASARSSSRAKPSSSSSTSPAKKANPAAETIARLTGLLGG
ncbi:MAG: hypothetical protein JWM31_3630 [Solirubrobacterales bacterium]|nr:hypothetical protein [Solirubrobacterales bacterium]